MNVKISFRKLGNEKAAEFTGRRNLTIRSGAEKSSCRRAPHDQSVGMGAQGLVCRITYLPRLLNGLRDSKSISRQTSHVHTCHIWHVISTRKCFSDKHFIPSRHNALELRLNRHPMVGFGIAANILSRVLNHMLNSVSLIILCACESYMTSTLRNLNRDPAMNLSLLLPCFGLLFDRRCLVSAWAATLLISWSVAICPVPLPKLFCLL